MIEHQRYQAPIAHVFHFSQNTKTNLPDRQNYDRPHIFFTLSSKIHSSRVTFFPSILPGFIPFFFFFFYSGECDAAFEKEEREKVILQTSTEC